MTRNLLSPFGWFFGVLGTDKSFRQNPIIGSRRLNELGLHRARVQLAAAMAKSRRARMAKSLSADDVASLEREGFVLKYPALPKLDFEALRAELFRTPLPAKEMRQGPTTTRLAPLTSDVPLAREFANGRDVRRLMGYASGRAGAPAVFLQTVTADAAENASDPQTALHSDTFHSTAKLWLFLEDVGEEEGPFVYVPGSHRLTDERLQWEHEQSLTARDDPRLHHTLGSFRLEESQLRALGYGQPRTFSVKANTLVVADTYGFHRRSPSYTPTSRVELHGHLRSNPFIPWNGGNVTSLPGIAENQAQIWFTYLNWRERNGRPGIWRDVGLVTHGD